MLHGIVKRSNGKASSVGELRPHQIAPAEHLLKLLGRGINAVDLSDTGTGKTYVATYIAKALGQSTLAVVPKISKTAWHRAAAHFGDEISVVGYEQLRTGRSDFGRWDNNPPAGFRNESYFKCQCCQLVIDLENYTPCYTHPAGIHCLEEKKKSWKYGKFRWPKQIRFLIFDEIHRCSGIKSRNADMLIAARRQGILTLGLSATAACGPLQLRALGYLLGLHSLGNFYDWSRRYGCGKLDGIPGWHWLVGVGRQKDCMTKLNKELIPAHGVRVRVDDIPGFPQRTIEVGEYDLAEGADKLDALYAEMHDSTTSLKERAALDKSADHPLTKTLRQRQMIELLKVPLAVELTQDYVAKGYSVGLFVNFSQTIEELKKRLKCNCVIDGSHSGTKWRDHHIMDFQNSIERVMILNSEAGGVSVSLHDLTGGHPRVGLVMPPLSARTFKQLCGRFHREGAKSPCHYKVLLAAGTCEPTKYKKLKNKVDNIDALNDSDFEV